MLLSLSQDMKELKDTTTSLAASTAELQARTDSLDGRVSRMQAKDSTGDNTATCSESNALPIETYSIGRYSYHISTHYMTWHDSRNYCRLLGGDLAHIGVRNWNVRQDIMQALAWENLTNGIWIGLDDIDEEGKWVWVNGDVADDDSIDWYP